MARHLVIGAGGFIGRHLAHALAGAGVEVTRAGRGVGGEWDRDLASARDADLVRLVAGHAVVTHLAWSTVPQTSEADPAADLAGNVGLFLRILRAAGASGARVVFVSSGGTVYGRGGAARFGEDHPLRPIGAHGAGKAAAELYAHAFRQGHKLDVRIARLSNPFGAGQGGARLQGAVSRFVATALRGETIEIWGDGGVVRDYLHIADAVAGLIRLGEVERDALGPDPVFNLGGGVGTSLTEVVGLIGAAIGRAPDVRHLPGRAFDVPRNVLDIARAADRLGWRPRLTVREGIARMITDLRADPHRALSTLDEEPSPA